MIGFTQKEITRVFICALAFGLGACEMYAPDNLNQSRIQVTEQNIVRDYAVSEMTDGQIMALANAYDNHGGSPMDVTVTYDPKSYRNTAMTAGDEAARIAKALRKEGVDNVNVGILPVNSQGDEGRVLISYRAVEALAPAGCTDMPGLRDRLVEPDPTYRLGCGVDTMIAKQVANPSDLLGRDNTDATTDGRAAANIVELYRTGARNEPLDGESASGTK